MTETAITINERFKLLIPLIEEFYQITDNDRIPHCTIYMPAAWAELFPGHNWKSHEGVDYNAPKHQKQYPVRVLLDPNSDKLTFVGHFSEHDKITYRLQPALPTDTVPKEETK